MKKILIFSPNGYPEENANTKCILNIIEGLKKSNYTIDYFCININGKNKSNEVIEGVTYYRFKSFGFSLKYYIDIIASKKKLVPLLRKLILYLPKILDIFFFEGYVSLIPSKKIIKTYKKIAQKNNYSVLLSFSLPFTSHVIASKLHSLKLSSKWIAYELDPFAYNYTLHKKKIRNRMKKELLAYKDTDIILSTYGIINENSKNGFRKEYLDKNYSVFLPNLAFETNSCMKNSFKYDFIYTGQFYGIRHPNYMLDFFLNLSSSYNFAFLGSIFPTDSNLKLQLLKEKNKVSIFPWLPKTIVRDMIWDSSILINISNNLPNQIPSKLLDYMSTGKPILNFYYIDNDPSFLYLSKYPSVLNVKIGTPITKELITEFMNFYSVSKKQLNIALLEDRFNELHKINVIENIIQYIESDDVK